MAHTKKFLLESSHRPFSRRTLLKGLGAGVGAGALGLNVYYGAAQAQSVPAEGPLGLERTTVGEVELTG